MLNCVIGLSAPHPTEVYHVIRCVIATKRTKYLRAPGGYFVRGVVIGTLVVIVISGKICCYLLQKEHSDRL